MFSPDSEEVKVFKVSLRRV